MSSAAEPAAGAYTPGEEEHFGAPFCQTTNSSCKKRGQARGPREVRSDGRTA
jgi:hypothetical protein